MLTWSRLRIVAGKVSFTVTCKERFTPVTASVLCAHVFVQRFTCSPNGMVISAELKADVVEKYRAHRAYWIIREDTLEFDEYADSVLPPRFEDYLKGILGGKAA